jgi:hypothetical protein
MKLIEQLKWRYATKKFDPEKKVSAQKLELLKEAVQLSVSSYGLQLYKVLIIENPEIRAQLRPASWDQSQVTDASHLFVFCTYQNAGPEAVNISNQKLARWTGLFYFLIMFCGLYSGLVVRGSLIDFSNPTLTLNNLIAGEFQYRLGFVADLVMVISDVTVSVLFYFLLKPVHQGLAALAAAFRLIQSAVLGANLINLYKPLVMIQGQDQLHEIQRPLLETELINQLQLFEFGYLISGVFFAINCLLMGILLYRSSLFPKPLGMMIGIASFGYLFNCLASFLAPSLIEVSQVVMFFTAVLSEVSLCLYLLIKGTKRLKKSELIYA